jgi:hypothetical protein
LLDTPLDDPWSWAEAAVSGIEVIIRTAPPAVADRSAARAALAAGIDRLVAAGAQPLGHISLAFATRPLVDVLDEITRWALLPVVGLFLDHAPAGPYHLGPTVWAVRAARRFGLGTIVVNPGVPVDPTYRRLEATICTFEGSWSEYVTWSAHEQSAIGDGHLVFGVPRDEWRAARALIVSRGAGLLLVTDRPAPDVAASVRRKALSYGAPGRPTIPYQNAHRGNSAWSRVDHERGEPPGSVDHERGATKTR